MASKIPPIGKTNHVAIAGMASGDLLRAREYYILRIIRARREDDSDTLEIAIDWLVSLTSEMRLRGGDQHEQEQPSLITL